jgi:hypothetical protein
MNNSEPKALEGIRGAMTGTGSVDLPAAPSAQPPKQLTSGRAGRAVTTQYDNQIVNSLWTINEDRNSWTGIQGVGWIKLSTASDTGVVALTALAAHAYQTQHVISYRQESDGMIHEIYAW